MLFYKGYIQIGSDGYIIQPVTHAINKNLLDGTPHSLEKLNLGHVKVNEDTYETGSKRPKRSTSGWNGYYLGDIWKSRSNSDTPENSNHHTYPPSEVLFFMLEAIGC